MRECRELRVEHVSVAVKDSVRTLTLNVRCKRSISTKHAWLPVGTRLEAQMYDGDEPVGAKVAQILTHQLLEHPERAGRIVYFEMNGAPEKSLFSVEIVCVSPNTNRELVRFIQPCVV
jgi:hypothetical protein